MSPWGITNLMPMLPSLPPPLPIEGGAGCGSVAIVLAQHVGGPGFNPKEWGWVSRLEPALKIQGQENERFTVTEFEASLEYTEPCLKPRAAWATMRPGLKNKTNKTHAVHFIPS